MLDKIRESYPDARELDKAKTGLMSYLRFISNSTIYMATRFGSGDIVIYEFKEAIENGEG